MKSEGTCVCGGKITFKTSGQQVMITPPLSMREAGTVVYSNPLFKKEDFKTVQKKEQKKDDIPTGVHSNGLISLLMILISSIGLALTNVIKKREV